MNVLLCVISESNQFFETAFLTNKFCKFFGWINAKKSPKISGIK